MSTNCAPGRPRSRAMSLWYSTVSPQPLLPRGTVVVRRGGTPASLLEQTGWGRAHCTTDGALAPRG